DRAGAMAWNGGDAEAAVRLHGEAESLYEAAGDLRSAALVAGHIAVVDRFTGRIAEAVARLERAVGVLAEGEADEDYAELLARTAQGHWSLGDVDKAAEWMDQALEIAERGAMTHVLARAFVTRGAIAHARGRHQEGR